MSERLIWKKNEISSRFDVINKIGEKYRKHNIETDEFSYRKVLKKKTWSEEDKHYKLDLRFESIEEKLSIIVELKNEVRRFTDEMEKQLLAYRELEKQYRSKHKIISILYDLKNKHIKVWKDDEELTDEVTINSFEYYLDLYSKKINDKDKVLETTNDLNKLLHSYHIQEEQRSQFVGSLLVALNNGLEYIDVQNTRTVIERIKSILESKIEDDENKKIKTELLIKILDKQNIRELKYENLFNLLSILKKDLIPFINNKTAQGEDLLNLFFTTFNKYVGKKDKNQAYTPTHITDFMCDIVDLRYNSKVLDPTCGSGAFLVQAMSKMLHKAQNDEEIKKNIKKNQLFGIEQEEKAFGLATTNMLIHDDGKSNIINASCFEKADWIKGKNIDVILMNNLKIDEWKEFKIRDIFKQPKIKKFSSIPEEEGLIPFVTSKSTNQGVETFIDTNHTIKNVITVSTNGNCFDCFYHDQKIAISNDVDILSSDYLNEFNALFITTILRLEQKKWNYGRKPKNKAVINTTIKLPAIFINGKWKPNWQYMENYIKALREIDDLYQSKNLNQKNILNLDNWKWFSLGELLKVTRGQRIVRKQDYEENPEGEFNIPVITTTTGNNGIDGYYTKHNSNGNVLITCGEVSGMFTTYQENPIWALDTVRILEPKFKFNKILALFLIPILNANMFRFSYGRKAKPSHVRNIKIKLPADSNGQPDWEYMENYIKSLPYSKYI